MAQIDYFFSVFSPWTYLAGNRLEDIAARHGATVTYKPLDLLGLFDRTGGTRPAARHPSRMAYRGQELARWAARLGVPMLAQPTLYPPNPAPASYAIIAAQQAGGGDTGALVQGLARALWVEDRNIAEDEVIRAALTAAGFSGDLVTTGLFTGAMAYEKNLEEAVDRGVFGSPFYIVAETDQRFWGQDRLDFLDAHLGEL
ncbi:2-hydroxychromene-2-carboxylate isomerase [Rhodobacter xanthinilyticus]|uniref:2-hydroxychromene-2-carboxylate isomerase n=1 Tax=Rhodobacter xanthinilyticus TaxID=1850250 RepID=A0A1D9ME72_9RHOB|nr:2-hydroxychromene-2-carboxylate isomerase [Rhodobacter xanthinilyticus]AOZ70174.1 2-hydroxychromene-2-carboxylate isomerase [Rhodobacter xanthinilyticus]